MRYYIVIGILIFAIAGAAVLAWEDCPFGLENDPWPGQCSRYWDSDDNGICDLSEPAPDDRAVNIIETETGDTATGNEVIQTDITDDTNTDNPTRTRTYHVLEIGAVLSVLYLITYLASQNGKITYANHKKLWNWMLLGTFMVAAILGLIMAIILNYGWVLPFADSMYIHVEFGIAMAFISIFHVLWHWKYYFKGSKKEEKKPEKKKNKRRN